MSRENPTNNIEKISELIGRPVVSVETANKLGHISDVLVDQAKGCLAGFAIDRPDETCALVSVLDVKGIGPDAIMVERDESLVWVDSSPLHQLARAKADLVGVKVISEDGHLLGNISNIFLYLTGELIFIYEVRSSLFDLLFGHAFYFSATLGCALSDDGSALVVCAPKEGLDRNLAAAAQRLIMSDEVSVYAASGVEVEIRSHAGRAELQDSTLAVRDRLPHSP